MMFIFFDGGLNKLKLVLFLVVLVLSVCFTWYNVRVSDRVWSRAGPWSRTQTKKDRNGTVASYYCARPEGIHLAQANTLPSIALLSYPGSGNTWVRYLIERATGIYTGSIYTDNALFRSGFKGESKRPNCGCTSVVKMHDVEDNIRRIPWQRAILLMRNPYDAMIAEKKRQLTHSHTGQIQTREKYFHVTVSVCNIIMAGEEKVCIVTSVSSCMLDVVPEEQETVKDDYNIIQWSEFIQNPDPYFEKVQGLLLSPIQNVQLTDDLLRKMTNLKVVCSVGVGVDHLDLPLLRKYGIKVGNTPDVVTQPTADFAFTLMLAIGRRIPEMMEAARGYEVGQKFEIERSFRLRGQDIFESTLGIIGLGKIGLEVARRAQGFRMKILYHNRKQRLNEIEGSVHATYVQTLAALLPQVDFLIVCAPLNPSTRHMITLEQLKLMKSSSFLINIARGGIIKTDDLVEALQSRRIAGAALDATDPDILPKHHPLLHMPNVIICPHSGVFTEGGLEAIYRLALRNLKAAVEGRPMPAEFIE